MAVRSADGELDPGRTDLSMPRRSGATYLWPFGLRLWLELKHRLADYEQNPPIVSGVPACNSAVTPTVRPGSFVEYKGDGQTSLHRQSMSTCFTLPIKKQLLVAGVRYARQEVAPAVGHGGGCKFFAFRGTPLAHGGVDGCRPLVDAFGIGVANDEAAGGRC